MYNRSSFFRFDFCVDDTVGRETGTIPFVLRRDFVHLGQVVLKLQLYTYMSEEPILHILHFLLLTTSLAYIIVINICIAEKHPPHTQKNNSARVCVAVLLKNRACTYVKFAFVLSPTTGLINTTPLLADDTVLM